MKRVSADVRSEVTTEEPREIVFYDGNCGLCHRAVRFLLSADPEGRAFVYAPLFGDTFSREIPEHLRAAIPDSLVLKTKDGRVHVRSEAVLLAMMRLGPMYRWLATLARIVPRLLRDLAYDGVAKIRHALFARPADACPLVPPRLRSRFLP
jgi:predicted DCC family thiol-disulfide oxidoreductase YuxK